MRKRRKNYRRRMLTALISAAAVILSSTAAFADVGDTRFAPLMKASPVVTVSGSAFADAGGSRVARSSAYYAETGALIPKDAKYRQQIEYIKSSTSKVEGGVATTSQAFIGGNLKDFGQDTLESWIKRMHFFHMGNAKNAGAGAVRVRYSGYRLYDPSAGKYIPVDVLYTVEEWSKAKKNWHKVGDGKPILGIGKVFHGLPCILMGNIANLRIRFTVYRAGTSTVLKNQPMSFTYGDIDTGQAVSIKTGNSKGFLCLNTSDLRFAPSYKGYHAVIGDKTLQNHSQDPDDSMGYFGVTDSTGSMSLIYTSNQIADTKKGTTGYPNGTHSWFSVFPFNKNLAPPLDPPVKRVYDAVTGDDVRSDGTHDTVRKTGSGSGNAFWYVIRQKIPAGYDGKAAALAAFRFTDHLPKYVVYDRFQVKAGGKDVTSSFQKSGDDYICNMKASVTKLLYGGGKGAEVELKIFVHIKDGTTMEQLRAKYETAAHPLVQWQGRDCVDIPNTASTSFTPKEGLEKEQVTNTVLTRIGLQPDADAPKHRLRIRKTADPETDGEFTFHLDLSSLEPEKDYRIVFGAAGAAEPRPTAGFRSDAEGGTGDGLTLKLSHGETAEISDLPEGAVFTVREEGTEGYSPEYQVSEGAEAVTVSEDAGGQGEALSSRSQCFCAGEEVGLDEAYGITYDFHNEKSIHHELIVEKKIEGEEADDSDAFAFHVEFSGISESAEAQTFAGCVENEAGDVVRTIAARPLSGGQYTQNVQLKGGQKVRFRRIPEGITFRIIEDAGEYAGRFEASVTGEGAVLSGPSGSCASGEALQSAEETTGTSSSRYTYVFTNTLDSPPPEEKTVYGLRVAKQVEGDPSDVFPFHLEFRGLTEPKYIALVPGEESYRLQMDSTGTVVITTEGGDVSGLPVRVIRPDGAERVLWTDADGKIPADAYVTWVGRKQKGPYTFHISWIGGTVHAQFAGLD